MATILQTERLIFRDWQTSDLEAFHSICSDPRVMRFVGDGRPWPQDRTREFIQRSIESSKARGFCQWPLIHKADLALIGYCGFVHSGDRAEIGWRLAAAHWGQGLATEAARCALKHGFEVLGFASVFATVQASNRASIRIVEKLGMQPESIFERRGREMAVYSLDSVRYSTNIASPG